MITDRFLLTDVGATGDPAGRCLETFGKIDILVNNAGEATVVTWPDTLSG